ncbi:MAG: nitroreductase [Verrucomicrobiales bacterium]|nr:nitroreductase [Verrucomicrobiales bacterium]
MKTTIGPSQLLGQLKWRYAVKEFDRSRKISPELWSVLEDVLVLTPSSGGLQPWAFVVVDNPVLREKLVGASYGQTKVKDASHLVVFTAKQNFNEMDVDAHINRVAQIQGKTVGALAPLRSMLVGSIVKTMDRATINAWAGRQAAIALGNLLTSAALLGVDACPMEGFVPAEYDAILNLSEKRLASIALCTLGYRVETDAYASVPKVRFSKETVIFHV